MEDLYEDLKEKINKLEYTEIKNIKDDITQIKLDLNTNNILTRQSIDANDKLSNTMETFRDTMIEMAQNLKESNKISTELTASVKGLNEKVDGVENKMTIKLNEFDNKINAIDNKGKIDFVVWLGNNWFKVTTLLVVSGYLVARCLGVNIF